MTHAVSRALPPRSPPLRPWPPAAAPSADEAAFRALYKQLVEINTTLSVGSCNQRRQCPGRAPEGCRPPAADVQDRAAAAAQGRQPDRRAARQRCRWRSPAAAGPPDVVEARREDWQRSLHPGGGDRLFTGRGTSDDKAMAAVFTDSLDPLPPGGVRRGATSARALTCGERHPTPSTACTGCRTIPRRCASASALNEAAGGELDAPAAPWPAGAGRREGHQDFPARDHQPRRSQLAPGEGQRAVSPERRAGTPGRVPQFPIRLNPVTRAYFSQQSELVAPEIGRDMRAVLADPPDAAAADRLWNANPSWNSMLRTTCVATMIEGGHAPTLLPQRVRANELPHPAGRTRGGGAGADPARARRRGHRRHARGRGRPGHLHPPTLSEAVMGAGARGGGIDLAGRGHRAHHGHRRHRRPLPQQRRHPDLWRLRHVPRRRRQPRPRPERAHPREVPARRPPLPARDRQALRDTRRTEVQSLATGGAHCASRLPPAAQGAWQRRSAQGVASFGTASFHSRKTTRQSARPRRGCTRAPDSHAGGWPERASRRGRCLPAAMHETFGPTRPGAPPQ